jgi:hypothetical protein
MLIKTSVVDACQSKICPWFSVGSLGCMAFRRALGSSGATKANEPFGKRTVLANWLTVTKKIKTRHGLGSDELE